MFQEIGGTEILLIAIVALIVVGPKDLPVLLRKLGQFMAKLRGMAAEFRSSFDEMARQSELDELRKEVDAMRRGQWTDPTVSETASQVTQTFSDIQHGLTEVGVDLDAPVNYRYEPTPEEAAAAQAQIEAEEAAAPKPARKPRARKATVEQVDPPVTPEAQATPKAAPKPRAKRAAAPRKPKNTAE
ncbi:Sec-independent protein translocase protein TatB [Phenylobacterium deserti]|uniref:Sec-independent protein translocase protein TatB n=1 Tax=Phenylobacterium deserti TaxID=1914756 RepID=A0A328ACJ0_9CAUL|nr:twin-arginine translocase subunit TatB [Phenylobacterium deserti]